MPSAATGESAGDLVRSKCSRRIVLSGETADVLCRDEATHEARLSAELREMDHDVRRVPPLTDLGPNSVLKKSSGPQKVLSSEDFSGVFRSPTATSGKDEPAGQRLF
jgi:hypothetical protein